MPKSTLKMPSRKPDLKALSSNPSPSTSTTRKRKQPQDTSTNNTTQKSRKIPKRNNQDDKPNETKKSTTRTRAGTRNKPIPKSPSNLQISPAAEPGSELEPEPVSKPVAVAAPKAKPQHHKPKPLTTSTFISSTHTQKQHSLTSLTQEFQKATTHLRAQNALLQDVLASCIHPSLHGKDEDGAHDTPIDTVLSAAQTTLSRAEKLVSVYRTFCTVTQERGVTTTTSTTSNIAAATATTETDSGKDEDGNMGLLMRRARGGIESEAECLGREVRGWFEGGNDSAHSTRPTRPASGRYLMMNVPSWAETEGVLGQVIGRLVRLSG